MQKMNAIPGLDDIADAVAARLAGRLPLSPAGGPGPQLPPGIAPQAQLDDPYRNFRSGSSVGIAGVEFTQSTQYFESAYGSDNGVPLIAYKTMVARVYPYMQRGILGDDSLTGQRVTGELTLSIGSRVIYTTGPTRAEGARLGSSAQIDRGVWDSEYTFFGGGRGPTTAKPTAVNSPLNFVVPAYYCKLGRVYVTVRIWPVADGEMSSRSATSTAYLQFIDVPAPKVCLVRVNWVDGAGNVNRPSDKDMLATLGVAERMLPFPYFETTILGTEMTSSQNFSVLPTNAGGCNTAWLGLITDLNVTRIFTSLFQLGDIVFGMVPQASIPAGAGKINTGCGIGSGGGFVGYNTTFAHEIGHLYNRSHVAVPGDSSSDPNYPKYGGSARSIGEVGIDTGATPPTVYDPSNSDDIMSYGNNQWISPYTYLNILDARDLHPSAPVDPRRLRPLLVLDFRLHRRSLDMSRVEIRRSIRIEAAGPVPARPAGLISPVSVDLLDRDGRILSTHHCTWEPAHGGGNCNCGCGGSDVPLEREPWLDFQEAIEWPSGDVASIAFHNGEAAFHTIPVGEAPYVSIEGPGRREGQLVVRVNASHPRERVSVVVLFSADDGLTWQPVAYDPPNGEVVVEADHLPGGARCFFRAIATAELQPAVADSEAFELQASPRRLYLNTPADNCAIAAGPVALSAMVDTRGLGPIAPAEIRWTSNIDGELGYGYSLAPDLGEGRHELTVTAPDGLGGMLAQRAIIIVSGRPR